MAKVTIQMVEDAGFRPEQFGTPADWSTASIGYLARAIQDAERWVRARVGDSVYDAAVEGFALDRLTAAEFARLTCLLWRRRAAFIDSNAASAMDRPGYLERREYEATAAAACARAEAYIVEALAGAPDNYGSGAALTSAESGPYFASSAYAFGERLP